LKGGTLFVQDILDVSAHGISFCMPAEEAKNHFVEGQHIDQILLLWGDSDLYTGTGTVKHLRSDDQKVHVGLELSTGCVDLHALHRWNYRLALASRWKEVEARSILGAVDAHDFRAWVLNTRRYLTQLKMFLDAEERAVGAEDRTKYQQNLDDIFSVMCPLTFERMTKYREDLTAWALSSSEDERVTQRPFLRDQLGPLLMECPFTRRAFEKPLGYAGDYELMSILYRPGTEGKSLFARMLNFHSKHEPAGKAVINRIAYLGNVIAETLAAFSPERVKIANIGCGAARELVHFLNVNPELGNQMSVTLVDQDERAIEICERTLTPLARETNTRFNFVCDPIQRLITATNLSASLGTYNLVYSAGLFDYLEDQTFIELTRVLFQLLPKDGRLVIGNMADHNPSRYHMEYSMDWFLIYRSKEELMNLGRLATSGLEAHVWVDGEPEGVNLFLHIANETEKRI